MGDLVKVGEPTYHRKRKYFTLPATGDTVHEINLDYISYPLINVEQLAINSTPAQQQPSGEEK